ncbi:UNVERIFIED_CONTAM: hypothetical protein FKN15_066437 [Acipenser sinensis]
MTLQDSSKLSLMLEDTENWLYEEGEDQPKQVYVDKLAELKDSSKLSLMLEDTENWLYEEGEDQPKQVYVDKLAELKKYGQPIQDRHMEHEERPKVFDELGKKIQTFMKAVEAYKRKDERYDHVEAAEMVKVEKCVGETMVWMNNKMNAQSKLSAAQDPAVKVSEILVKTQMPLSRAMGQHKL